MHEEKLFGICCVNHRKEKVNGVVLPFCYYIFNEEGLRLWLRKLQITFDEKHIVDAQPGDTCSLMAKHNIVFWRIK